MARRKGMMKGRGRGYKNVVGKDPLVHSQSAKGMKQPQIPENVMNFIQRNPFVVKKALEKKTKLEDIQFNDDAIDNFMYKEHMIRLFQDDTPDDPRSWDNMGRMVCSHGRYNLGDEKEKISFDNFNSWNEVAEYLEKEKGAVISLPLYLYDHSGLRMKVGSFSGLLPQGHAEFDSGQVGFVYATAEDIKNTFQVKKITKSILKKATKNLEGEVETYDQYLSGDVYGYKVFDKNGEETDSLWGIYGIDEAQSEAKSNIDFSIK